MTMQLTAVEGLRLSDLKNATNAYLNDQVEVTIGRVTDNVETGEEGTFTVRWSNPAEPDGVRLTGVTLHLVADPGGVAKFKVPGAAHLQPRLVNDFDAPRPASNSLTNELFIFLPGPIPGTNLGPIDSILEVGETGEIELEYEGVSRGRTTFRAHVHATVAYEDLFPRSAGENGTADVRIR